MTWARNHHSFSKPQKLLLKTWTIRGLEHTRLYPKTKVSLDKLAFSKALIPSWIKVYLFLIYFGTLQGFVIKRLPNKPKLSPGVQLLITSLSKKFHNFWCYILIYKIQIVLWREPLIHLIFTNSSKILKLTSLESSWLNTSNKICSINLSFSIIFSSIPKFLDN